MLRANRGGTGPASPVRAGASTHRGPCETGCPKLARLSLAPDATVCIPKYAKTLLTLCTLSRQARGRPLSQGAANEGVFLETHQTLSGGAEECRVEMQAPGARASSAGRGQFNQDASGRATGSRWMSGTSAARRWRQTQDASASSDPSASNAPAAATAAAALRGSGSDAATVERVVDAIRRSPLALELPSDTPGLANIASSLVRLDAAGCCCPALLPLTPAAAAARLVGANPQIAPRPHPNLTLASRSAAATLLTDRRRTRSPRRSSRWCASTACSTPRRSSPATSACSSSRAPTTWRPSRRCRCASSFAVEG